MVYKITKPDKSLSGTIYLTSSKSESNRVLLVQALCSQKFKITNIADSQDTQILSEILKNETSGEHYQALKKLNVEVSYYTGAGGTTIRFLTAFFASREGTRILSGSERMNERPVKNLVDALKKLGAKITYLGKEGYPPLKIEGKPLQGGEVEMDASVSSQFVTALLLIAPAMKNGLTLRLKGNVVSRSYIRMTLKILDHFGVKHSWKENIITVEPQQYQGWDYQVEADWSSASYWYEMAALAQECDLFIKGLKRNSIHGDSSVAGLFGFFGINTEFREDGIRLVKTGYKPDHLGFDFSDYPDIVQTSAVAAAALQIPIQMNGLHTLRVKETDRIEALKTELKKIGVVAEETGKTSLEIKKFNNKTPAKTFQTYQDHRMAMSFAPLALVYPEVRIENPSVVKKSYPDFWNDLKTAGFEITEEA